MFLILHKININFNKMFFKIAVKMAFLTVIIRNYWFIERIENLIGEKNMGML